MLNCRACLWQCVQPFDRPANLQRIRRNVSPLLRQSPQRLQSTNIYKTGTRPHYLAKVEKLSQDKDEPWKNSAVAGNQKKWERTALRQSSSRDAERLDTPNLTNLGRKPPHVTDTDWNRRKRELRYLQDPLDLAQFVRAELNKDKVDEMKQLVQMASHSMACVVSWNHIIDYYLAKSEVTLALKVYNDMKKRAQFPDSYTYTILLRGLSINAHMSGVLEKALSIYHSLYAPNSRVEPSIIHTNAALRVCARALDMDALWGIAAKIPETGPAAANATTYNTIINAIRQSMLLKVPNDESAEEAAARKDRSIMEARRLWEDIAGKWRNADLVVDEELVCSMARLLLLGARPRDWDDVLSLIEQTMDIPRLVPRLGTHEREKAGFPRLRAPDVPDDYKFDDDHLAPDHPGTRGEEFLPFTGNLARNLAFVKPGNNTLSVLQEACLKIAAPKAAQKYWDMLVDPVAYHVKPDINNLNQQLRNLRQNRSSAAAVELLQQDIIDKGIKPGPGTFRIAMSTCVRDKNNHNSLKHASQILHRMKELYEDADAKTVGMYADLALSFPLATGQDLIDALTSLHPIVKNLRLQLGIGGAGSKKRGATYLTGQPRQDALTALRKVYAVYDRLLLSNLIAEEQKQDFKKERARLSAFILREVERNNTRKARDLDEQNRTSEGEFDQHSYLKDDEEGGKGADQLSQDTPAKGRYTFAMGNDGGSIPKRRELVKEAAKALTTTQAKEQLTEQQEYHWSTCPLSRKPLATPVVGDAAGTLYNKDAVIEFLLTEDGREKEEAGKVADVKKDGEFAELGCAGDRLKGLKDVVEIKFEMGKEEKKEGSGRSESWVCPITGRELGPGAKAVYIVPCGHAFAGSVVKEVAGSVCLQCNEPYAENDVIPILPTIPTDLARLNLRLKTLKEKGLTHALKKAPGSKKRKKTADKPSNDAPTNGTTNGTTKSKSPSDEENLPAPSATKPAPPTGLKNSATASLTRKVLEEQEARNKRRKLGQNENVKSLFNTSSNTPSAGNSADYMTRGFSIGRK
ncbi:hypothetical protein OPT61_g8941 [Boeremia exigua]|uniref:Uncharacterized protein n=1 Tax=Boeremia exigua TaxID=749465 RepID=A0ACC2HW49_9PLEO|nr:hypothetical protein OPT61_g8941 [Boeremia exigua]